MRLPHRFMRLIALAGSLTMSDRPTRRLSTPPGILGSYVPANPPTEHPGKRVSGQAAPGSYYGMNLQGTAIKT